MLPSWWVHQHWPSPACRLYNGADTTYHNNSIRAETSEVGDTEEEGRQMTSCSIRDCSGEYERTVVTHTVRHHGELVVIDQVPAEVCSVCNDVLLSPQTIIGIEKLLRSRGDPVRTVPLYAYGDPLAR